MAPIDFVLGVPRMLVARQYADTVSGLSTKQRPTPRLTTFVIRGNYEFKKINPHFNFNIHRVDCYRLC